MSWSHFELRIFACIHALSWSYLTLRIVAGLHGKSWSHFPLRIFSGVHRMCWSHIQLRIFAGVIGLMSVTNLSKWGESVINLHKLDEFNTVSPLFNENLIPVF